MSCTFVPDPESGDFEAGPGLWQGGSGAVVDQDASQVHSGTFALKVESTQWVAEVSANVADTVDPMLDIVGTDSIVGADGTLEVTCWFYVPAGSALTTMVLIVAARLSNSGTLAGVGFDSSPITYGTWFSLTATATLAAGATKFYVAVSGAPTGPSVPAGEHYWVDDVCYAGHTLRATNIIAAFGGGAARGTAQHLQQTIRNRPVLERRP